MKRTLLSTIFILFAFAAYTQVATRYLSDVSAMVPGYAEVTTINTRTINYTASVPDPEPTPVDEDTTTEGNGVFIYGDVIPASINMSDGNITPTSIGNVWTLRISIPNAKNIGFSFSQFSLSPNAEMYIFNENRTILKGGIKQETFTDASNVSISPITANAIIIYIIEPNNFNTIQSNVTLAEVTAGFQDIEEDLSTMARHAECMIDVQCFPDKQFSARAVARISVPVGRNRVGLCTGTLVNNEANDGRAFLLTAFHCVDENDNKVLEADEINAFLRANFQFHLWKTECGGNEINPFIEYTGATLRASYPFTDMALFELNNPPGVGDSVNYAGWSRNEDAPSNTESYVIHHPRGFDMRLTPTRRVRNFFWNGGYWQASYQYARGAVAPGSSGSALFNENGQVVGQLKGGWSGCFTQGFSDRYGKFDESWTGFGTNETRLSNWLSTTQNLNNSGTLVSSALHVQGPEQITCANDVSYSVSIRFLDASYEWSVSSNLQIISGLGTPSITVRATNGNNNNEFINVIVRTPTKGHRRFVTLNKTIIVGDQNLNFPIYGVNTASCDEIVTFRTEPGALEYYWSWPYDWTYISGEGTTLLKLRTPQHNTYNDEIVLGTFGQCMSGGTLEVHAVEVRCSYYYYSMSPNPTSSTVTVSAKETTTKGQKVDKAITELNVYDKFGNLKKRQKFNKMKKATLDVSNLSSDIYILEIADGNSRERQQLS
ncbi:MAG: hypothetical protein JWQ96_1559, partial [Segetibacter sp.]|nr:hypothetical protein [Segetibacter sp.]